MTDSDIAREWRERTGQEPRSSAEYECQGCDFRGSVPLTPLMVMNRAETAGDSELLALRYESSCPTCGAKTDDVYFDEYQRK